MRSALVICAALYFSALRFIGLFTWRLGVDSPIDYVSRRDNWFDSATHSPYGYSSLVAGIREDWLTILDYISSAIIGCDADKLEWFVLSRTALEGCTNFWSGRGDAPDWPVFDR